MAGRVGRAVAVVTDSTASLPAAVLDAVDVVVVPLQVVIDGVAHREGIDLSPGRLDEVMRAGAAVTTSQPGPEAFARVYARVAARGAREIVSVHLSGELSSTLLAAELAAQTSGVPVHVVDSRTVGMGLGFAVLAAAGAANRDGATGASVAQVARQRAAGATALFAVDTLEHLRRGGRLSPVAAALGTVLGLRPVLGLRKGRIEVVEKVRTSGRARERLLAMVRADTERRDRFDIAVHHLGDPTLANTIGEQVRALCGPGLQHLYVAELSAVVGAHSGPGTLAVVVADA